MITLRADQEDARVKLRVALRNSTAVLLFAPTGFGKTVLAAALIAMIAASGKRVIFCVHRVDLIRQTEKTFEKFGIFYSHIAAGYHHNPHAKVLIASISTLARRLGKYPADYVLVDEAHLSAASGWASVALHYREAGAKLIGLTGSPERLDGKPLGDVWDKLVMGPSVSWLIEQGFLSKYRAFAPKGIDFSSARISKATGEYDATDLEKLMAGKAILSNAVAHWRKYAAGKRTIAFTRSVKAAEELAAEFRANGIMAVALDGETPQPDRLAAFNGFADRTIEVICNCQLMCEGFDLAAQVGREVVVECVLDHAPSQSLAKTLQKWGRGLRYDGTVHILLDLVGSLALHGFPDDDREWSLEGRKKKPKASGEEAMRVCPNCYAAFAPQPVCPECGFVHVAEAHVLDQVEGELEEIDVLAVRANRVKEQSQARSLEELIALATGRGYKSPAKWAAHIFTSRAAKDEARLGR